jgi:hypothetical protein
VFFDTGHKLRVEGGRVAHIVIQYEIAGAEVFERAGRLADGWDLGGGDNSFKRGAGQRLA